MGGNGSIDFEEWVNFMIFTREETFAAEKAEEEYIVREVKLRATQLFKEIFKGELSAGSFVKNFTGNDQFVKSVVTIMNIPKEELKSLKEEDLMDFFKFIDVDASGTVSYDEFVDAVVKFRLAQCKEERAKNLKSNRRKKMEIKEPPGLKPLPELEEQRMADKYLELSPSDDLDVKDLPKLLRELGLLIADDTVKSYLHKCFPGRDFSGGLKLIACTIVYKYALTAQPLQVLPLQKSASEARLTCKDARSQESTLRSLFASHAGDSKSISLEKFNDVLADIGLSEGVTFRPPEFLDVYKSKRTKSGAIDFREAVELCNAAVADQRTKALGLGLLRSNSAAELPRLKPSKPKRLDWTNRGRAVLVSR